ncbi:MAG: hypothetical protein ABEJ94_11870 [Halorientalis sp.]
MTHIQTEVPDEEYERLREVAEQQGLSIREALREATDLWLQVQETVDTDDPLFTSVEEVRTAAQSTPGTNVLEEDDLVEEWSGETADVELAEPDR